MSSKSEKALQKLLDAVRNFMMADDTNKCDPLDGTMTLKVGLTDDPGVMKLSYKSESRYCCDCGPGDNCGECMKMSGTKGTIKYAPVVQGFVDPFTFDGKRNKAKIERTPEVHVKKLRRRPARA